MKNNRRSRFRLPVALAVLALGGVALISGWESRAQVSLDGPADLIEWFKSQQEQYLPIAPPTRVPFLSHGSPSVLAFDPGDFPLPMLKHMRGYVEYDCPVYQIYLVEDPDTRETLILNERDKVIHAVPAPSDYDPYAFVNAKYPDLYDGDYSAAEIARLLALYDPARIQVATKLVPEDFYGNYMAADEEATAAISSALYSGGGMAMMSSSSSSQLWVSAFGPADGTTNSAEITVHLPDGFTNNVEVFAFDDRFAPYEGTDSVWLVVATDLEPASGTNVVLWTNSPLDDVSYRFYTAGSDYDQDGDGLSSAMEILTYNSSPTNIDSDADGYVDGNDGLISTSVYTNGVDLDNDSYVDGEADERTDPTNDDITPPSVTIDWPPDGYEMEWIP